MKEITFAMIKPHILKNSCALKRIMEIIDAKFEVVENKEILMTEESAKVFYAEHVGKFYFDRLMHLMCSGPSIALVLASEDGVKKWREVMGPTKVYKSIYSDPDSIRSLFGLSDTRNACHGADSIESAKKEISMFFPNFSFEKSMEEINSKKNGNKSI